MSLLEVTGLNSYYGDSHILFDVGLTVEKNEVVALLGRNGAGKSTTFKSLMGVVTPRTGSVRLDGVELAGKKAHDIARLGMQLVHEDRRIFGSLNVEENIILAGLTAPNKWPLARIYEIFPRLKQRRTSRGTDLSGGEQQMLAIARALVRDPKKIRGIIGPNGAGKSTFFKMLTCEVPPTSGKIVFDGRDITGMGVIQACQEGLTKSYQINQLFEKLTVRQNLEIAALGELRGKFKLDLFKNLHRVRKLDAHVAGTATLVHLTERLDTQVSELAYGEKRRLEIGLALATTPSLLLLDEPLAGMSAEERIETVALLKSIAKGRTLIIIDHDMDSLFELVGKVTVLQEGRLLVEGTPDEIKADPKVQEAYLGGMHGEME
ncbi:MAG TPA: ATP-binding cassette domain-containing protein [Ottowia sp.]|uniref:ATP-binding cassette domain-containing protein n=1 Tax=Ottowia sp. TaxID=1898956 RepID=UPI002C530AFA|nr:ATP-binding cassette domain-containing protein [Ottowia sp.]HMN21000.1 ATP-binding cassette domain-containing protein [Ottowia sp.]